MNEPGLRIRPKVLESLLWENCNQLDCRRTRC